MEFEKVRDIIVETLGCEAEQVTLEASLSDDLGADSLAAVELGPRPSQLERTLRLWGEPELLGLTILPEVELPFLELLWETGRIDRKELRVDWP